MILENPRNNKIVFLKLFFGIIFFPLLITIISYLLLSFNINEPYINILSIGVTYDLLIFVPIIYLILIWNSSVPKTTVIPVFFLVILIASYIIPSNNQTHLSFIKTWGLPVIEIIAFLIIFRKVLKINDLYKLKKDKDVDIFSIIKNVINSIFPGTVGAYLSFEMASIYYGLICWRKTKNDFIKFSYSNSGIMPVISIFIFLLVLETTILHLLLHKWNNFIAWVLTGLSLYTFIQIIAVLKSIIFRPIEIRHNNLHLNYGILRNSKIPIENIEKIELEKSIHIDSFSPFKDFEDTNIILFLNKKCKLYGLFGFIKEYDSMSIFVNNPQEFKNIISEQIKGIRV
ncbi:MAG: hypothetical protein OEZ13_06775 [Spirochaetia bacterium]|nr:hypothetical protein [Spirochaetia bacterium]